MLYPTELLDRFSECKYNTLFIIDKKIVGFIREKWSAEMEDGRWKPEGQGIVR